MFKIRAIAVREYLAAVRTKAFIVTILLMPFILGVSVAVQMLFADLESKKEKVFVVIDRTEGQKLGLSLAAITTGLSHVPKELIPEEYRELFGKLTTDFFGKNTKFKLVPPSEDTKEATAEQRQSISKEIEEGKYEALIEIGAKVYGKLTPAQLKAPKQLDDAYVIRFQSKSASAGQTRIALEQVLGAFVIHERMVRKGLSEDDIAAIQQQVPFRVRALTKRDPRTGQSADAADSTRVANIILPGAMLALMFMIVMVGAAPAMHGVIEEKSLRIAEVLLGSVTPFQLMAGKLAGIAGVSLTLAAVYLTGGFILANHFGFGDLFPLSILVYFVPMLLLALFSFGSLFIAVGAAANNIKDTQTLIMPIMMIACMPMFALSPIMQEPNGLIARVCTYFPFATPMLLVARQSVPPGVPWWEMLLGTVLVLATTVVCVWAAGRIFRVGILMQGKTPRFADLIRWAIKG